MTDLRLDHLCKSFSPALHALDDVSLSVAGGECLAIVGPSGCGKTTLLRVIAGLEAATSGSVHIGGARVDHRACHERDVAMLFQRPALVPKQTVRQNLRWAWTLRRPWLRFFSNDRQREGELVDMASQLGLHGDLDRPVQQLSGGQQQRVALGRCLLRRAAMLLLDEPFGHLDAPLRVDLRRFVLAIARRRGATMLLVTHDPAEAFAAGERVAVMLGGRIVQVGAPTELLRRPAHRFVAELAHHDRGGFNCIPAAVVGPHSLPVRTEISAIPGKLASKDQASRIIIGIAADKVSCVDSNAVREERVHLTLPMVSQETTASGTWIVARDERCQLVGRAHGDQRFAAGQRVKMTFAMQDAYGFDAMTGNTQFAPG